MRLFHIPPGLLWHELAGAESVGSWAESDLRKLAPLGSKPRFLPNRSASSSQPSKSDSKTSRKERYFQPFAPSISRSLGDVGQAHMQTWNAEFSAIFSHRR
jgi:hypothetical protein